MISSAASESKSQQEEIVQDNSREVLIANHCGLQINPSRSGPDAHDSAGNPFELKSTTRSGVSTARDVGLHTITEWRRKYWLVAAGYNYHSGYQITELYLAHPDDLEPRFSEIEQHVLSRLAPCEIVLEAARAAGVDSKILDGCSEIMERGATLNNPKIPLWIVEQNATKLDPTNAPIAQSQLREFVRSRPLST